MLNNLDDATQHVNLKMIDTEGLQSVNIKQLKVFTNKVPELTNTSVDTAPDKISLIWGETAVLTYNFDAPITFNNTIVSKKYYSKDYLKAIEANEINTFAFDSIQVDSGLATIRVGAGRAHGLSLRPEVFINGTQVEIPSDIIRGPAQPNRSQFFGILEIPFDVELLNDTDSNKVEVRFPDTGGKISSIILQVQKAYKPIVTLSNLDDDGVLDENDLCPNTPFLATVDATGCRIDNDEDGVLNEDHICPDTPLNVTVGADGCRTDNDEDSVLNDDDICPDTPVGAVVNETGCSVDNDSDGINNDIDKCPNTLAGTIVDEKGCALDGYFVNLFAKDNTTKASLDKAQIIINNDTLTSNSLGKISQRLLAGSYPIIVNHPYYVGNDTIKIYGNIDIEILIKKSYVDFKINIEKDGNRFKNASITIAEITQITNRLGYTTFTRLKIDSTYTFTISEGDELLKEGSFTVSENGVANISIETTGLKASTSKSQLTLFPNPVKNELYIKELNYQAEYVIYNTLNARVQKGITQSGKVNVTDLIQGVYFIQIENKLLKFVKR
ncbi:T9SS type A sorting domain-containing protein [Bacteroidales bacterium]|nr:T9SS type A sorting domain-containing protein [Bacteroidales bacterium]